MDSAARLKVGDVELDLGSRRVRRDGESIALQPRVYDLLVYLVEHRHRVVSKSELLERVWPRETVVPDALTTALHTLRRALGDDSRMPSFVRTVHRVGYQLIAPVTPAHVLDSPVLEARHATFVGRDDERSLFADVLDGGTGVQLLFFHGPPGIGKTTLLQELSYECRARGVEQVWLSGESAGPMPEAFVAALAREIGCEPPLTLVREKLLGRRVVIFVDDVHLLRGIDEWLRQALWPALPANVLLVLAGRLAPSTRWQCDAAWRTTARARGLVAFTPPQLESLIARRGLSRETADSLWKVTRGQPLAAALACDAAAMSGGPPSLLERGDVLDSLVSWFTDQIATEDERRAFEAACVVDELSSRTLAALHDPASASDRFAWLATLSFVDVRRDLLSVHAIVRDAVVARLGRRSPGRLAALLDACCRFFLDEFVRAPDPEAKLRATQMIIGMGRHHPALRTNYAASDAGPDCTIQEATGREVALLPEMVRLHEGAASSAIATRWLTHPGTRVWSVRDSADTPAGFLMTLHVRVEEREEVTHDAVVDAIMRFLDESGHARPGDEILVHRVLIARDDHQGPSIVTRHCHTVKGYELLRRRILSPSLAHVFSVYAMADVWEPAAASAGCTRLRDHEVTIGSCSFTPFYLSLRDQPVEDWLSRLSARLVEAVRAPSVDMSSF